MYTSIYNFSRRMGKPTICIGENKGADQLCSNCEADQRLCFRYTDSTFPLLSKFKMSSLSLTIFCDCTAQFVSDPVGIQIIGFLTPGSLLKMERSTVCGVSNVIHGVRHVVDGLKSVSEAFLKVSTCTAVYMFTLYATINHKCVVL